MECVTTPARVHVTARGGGTWIGGCEATGTVEVFEGSVSGNNLVAQVSPDSGFSTCTSESDRNNYVPEGELIWVRVTPNTSTDQGGNTARATTSPAGLCPSIDGTVAGTQLCYFNISGAADITVDFLNTEVP